MFWFSHALILCPNSHLITLKEVVITAAPRRFYILFSRILSILAHWISLCGAPDSHVTFSRIKKGFGNADFLSDTISHAHSPLLYSL